MKKSLVIMMVLGMMSYYTAADMIPADGDAWTEDSLTGWTATDTPAQSTDHQVGSYSITGGTVSENSVLELTLSQPIDCSDTDAAIHFWVKFDTADTSYNGSLKIMSEGNPGYAYYNWIGLSGTYGWTEVSYTLSSLSTWGGVFDASKVNYIGLSMLWIDSGQTSQINVDGLYWDNVTVPEPATISVIGLGALCGFIRRKRR